MLGQRIDGAIVVPQGSDSPGVKSLIARDLPLVFVDRRVQGIESVPFVVSDPYTGIREAMEELVALGHRRIGYIAETRALLWIVVRRMNRDAILSIIYLNAALPPLSARIHLMPSPSSAYCTIAVLSLVLRCR